MLGDCSSGALWIVGDDLDLLPRHRGLGPVSSRCCSALEVVDAGGASSVTALVKVYTGQRAGRVADTRRLVAGCNPFADRRRCRRSPTGASCSRCSSTGAGTPRSAVERGVRRPGHDAGPGRGPVDAVLLVTLRDRDRRRAGVRRRRDTGLGLPTRTTPATCFASLGERGLARPASAGPDASADDRGADLGRASTQTTILPTARDDPVDGRYTALPDAVRQDPAALPDPDRVRDRDGRRLDRRSTSC